MGTYQPTWEAAGLSRRDFFRVLSATSGAFLLSGCGPQSVALQVSSATLTQEPSFTPEPSQAPTNTPETVSLPPATPQPAPVLGAFPDVAVGGTYALPVPSLTDGLPLMQALLKRHSTRSFSLQDLPVQVLANLLWAGFGVNRPDTGGRTAPSANNVRDIDIFLATAGGLFRYNAEGHTITHLLVEDLRPSTGIQSFVAEAPLDLVYISDYSRFASSADREHWSWAHCGFIAQNVYLYCASEGLETVVRASIDRTALAERMGLSVDQHILLSQTIGYPAV